MILYITTGTVSYLTTLQDRHPDLMLNAIGQDAMMYRESEEENPIFESASGYDILYTNGTLSQEVTTAVHYIPVSGSGEASIMGHFSDLNQKLQNVNGLTAFRIGRARHKDSFIVFTQWADSSTITDFKDTDIYEDYLAPGAVKKFRDIGSVFHSSISSKIYLPLEENRKKFEDIPEEEREDY